MKKTLEDFLKETKNASKKGIFGLDECVDFIVEVDLKRYGSLYAVLEKYVERANRDVFFNRNMIQACWQLINERV